MDDIAETGPNSFLSTPLTYVNLLFYIVAFPYPNSRADLETPLEM